MALGILPGGSGTQLPTPQGLLEEAHLFNQSVARPAARERMAKCLAGGGQTREGELDLERVLAALGD